MLPSTLIFSINDDSKTLIIDELHGKIMQADYPGNNLSTINIIGSVNVNNKLSPGIYSSSEPMQVIITFE